MKDGGAVAETFGLFHVMSGKQNSGATASSYAAEGNQPVAASAGGQNAGAGFFQRCLAKSRGSTPEQRYDWREGIYDEIQELMPLQGSLSIERMCQMAGVSRAGFYRSLHERAPVEEEMEVRSVIQQIAFEHRRRYGYRRISAELRRRGMAVNQARVADTARR